MTHIVYDRRCNDGEVFPVGWPGRAGAYPETLVHLPKLRSNTGQFTTLHEFVHCGQFDAGGCTWQTYKKHMLYLEAQASAVALLWIAPRLQAKARRYFLECLRCYIEAGYELPRPYHNAGQYLDWHISRLRRMYREGQTRVSLQGSRRLGRCPRL